ncbi:MAG: right-handed parallel beta-helix repeat-containing protein [Dehalococcoidia bacterium]
MAEVKTWKGLSMMVALALVLALAAVAVPMAGTVWAVLLPTEVWVNDDGPSCPAGTGSGTQADPYCKIQTAINNVAPGGTVHVYPGKYNENIIIEKSLTLQSVSGDWQDTIIDDIINEAEITISGHVDVTVQGFEITAGAYGISIGEVLSTVNILDCFIHDNLMDGIRVRSGGDVLNIERNIISQNGLADSECGIYIDQAWNTTNIRDNIIGAWTYYPKGSGSPQRYGGNGGEGIYIYQVGNTSMVEIEGNKISENAWVKADTGIYINNVYGEVTIAGNDIGAWEDSHGGTYLGNMGQGIYVFWVYEGAVLTIGPDNRIRENTDDGIEIYNAHPAGAATITIYHNIIDINGWHGIELGTPCEVDGATISYNTITYNLIGIDMTGPSDHNIISDNEISNNAEGIRVEGYYNQILRNNILNNRGKGSGIDLGTTALGNIIHCNNIEGNLPYGVYNENVDEMVDATSNWWGDASGPSGAGPGSGDAVSENVNYSSWLSTEFQDCRECQGAPATAVPTVNDWGIAAMITLFAALLVWTVQRRRLAS